MKTIISFILATFTLNAMAIGFITLPKAEVQKIEQKAKKELQIDNLKLAVARLGGDGLRTHNLVFGKMTAADFQKARIYFDFNLSVTSFESSKNYELIDFLPPKMQAMVSKSFATSEAIPGTEALGSGENVDADLSMNCWSTTFDILRSKDEPTTSNLYQETNDVKMAKILRDLKYSTSVALKDLRPNDFVLYLVNNTKKEMGIDHVAISIGMGMVFEKTGPANNDYYQISILENVTNQRLKMNAGSKVLVEYRRLVKPFPHPTKLWGAKALGLLSSAEIASIPKDILPQIVALRFEGKTVGYNRIRPIKLTVSSNGRYVLDPRDPLTADLRGSSITGVVARKMHGFSDAALTQKVCDVSNDLVVQVLSAQGDSFKIKRSDYQAVDEEAKCISTARKVINTFWIGTTKLKPMH